MNYRGRESCRFKDITNCQTRLDFLLPTTKLVIKYTVFIVIDVSNMDDKPSQQEINAVAHFVEAVRELRKSPFFIEEYQNLSISMREGDPKEKIKGHFPDPNILRAVLVPFRRLWQQNECCYYSTVANIIKKYIPNLRDFVDSVLPNNKKSILQFHPLLKDISLPLSDVIDIWLNTRYMHTGKSNHRGKFDRSDFERFNTEIGAVLFEYCFLAAIYDVGLCFFNMQQCAESFLRKFSVQGLSPTFGICTGIEDGKINRITPGFTPESNVPAKRAWCLRRRRHYDGLNKFLDLIQCTDDHVARLLNNCENFDDFVAKANVHLEQTDDLNSIDKDDITHFNGCLDNHPTAIRNQRSRRGFVAKRRDGKLIWSEDYVPVLRDQYLEFRSAFKQEVFI